MHGHPSEIGTPYGIHFLMPNKKTIEAEVATITLQPMTAIGGGLEGAQYTTRETMAWTPNMGSPDQIINGVKDTADARSQDMAMNDGYVSGAVAIHKDNIVGAQYVLNSQPNWRALNLTSAWAEEFQSVVESRFNLIAQSEECWLDASRRNTFAGMVRLAIGSFTLSGEVLATAEWVKESSRPCKTAVQIISPRRLSNRNGVSDTPTLRRGVESNAYGRPIAYHIRAAFPTEFYLNADALTWKRVPAFKPWGRRQVIHIMEQLLPGQSRGVADMVSALKQMKMTKKFQEVTLQNAVVNATYAAAIESELPPNTVFETMGGADGSEHGMMNYLGSYMGALQSYLSSSKNIAIDGAKIPHLFPGTKLNLTPVGTPGGVGTDFEESLLRHIAACLGLSYEQFSRDYSKTNYSSARASMNETWKTMMSKKALIADRFANQIFALWLEEEVAKGTLPLPKGKTPDWFYEPMVKDALCACTWIGASRGQIDELKETQSAMLRIKAGLSTYEKESARLGEDFRDLFAQRAREEKMLSELGLSFELQSTKPNAGASSLAGEKKTAGAKKDDETEAQFASPTAFILNHDYPKGDEDSDK